MVLHDLSCGNARAEMLKLYETVAGHDKSDCHLHDGREESTFKSTVEVLL